MKKSKKKTVKKKKPTVKGKGKKKAAAEVTATRVLPRTQVPDWLARIRLLQKIQRVHELVPAIESLGQEVVGEGTPDEEIIPICEAKDVFKQIGKAMKEVGLSMYPIPKDEDKATARETARAFIVEVTYELSDNETGYSIKVLGMGAGCNGQWALNTAQTLAKKQAMLSTFNVSYGRPDDPKRLAQKHVALFELDKCVQLQPDETVGETIKNHFSKIMDEVPK